MKFTKNLIVLTFLLGVVGCSTTKNNRLEVDDSYLSTSTVHGEKTQAIGLTRPKETPIKGMVYLPAVELSNTNKKNQADYDVFFSDSETVALSLDTLSIKDFLHYVFGELLNVNYVLGQEVMSSDDKVTLNFQKKLTKRKLFTVSRQLLEERKINLQFNDDILYIHKSNEDTKNSFVYGYGNKIEDVPNTTNDIIQLAPYRAGVQASLAGTIKQLTRIDVQQLFQQSVLLIKGKRRDVVKALEFMALLDQPTFRNRQIAIYRAEFTSVEQLSADLINLLKQDGISASLTTSNDKAVSIIPIERINSLVLFSNERDYLHRASFWAEQLDKPADGNEKQFFIFEPEFARAVDLGQSLQLLLGGAGAGGLTNKTSARAQDSSIKSGASQSSSNTSVGVSTEGMKMVVDERSNSLIFEATGDKYKFLLPLIKRLDVLPKQVVLEVLIAEVKLTDVFKRGVTFALTNLGADITGGFNLKSTVEKGLNYTLTGQAGNVALNLLQTNSNVNVLSRPTLAVRDGVAANINVGDRIPVVGEIVTDPNVGSRSSVIYLETGINLSVTPTVNAQGVVLMEIEQQISSSSPGSAGAEGNPIFLDRAIKTEVIAGDGQTIMLGGLIDEKSTLNDRKVPFFSDLPILGKLFDGKDNNTVKTELVVFVTPKIVHTTNNWDSILTEFKQRLSKLEVK